MAASFFGATARAARRGPPGEASMSGGATRGRGLPGQGVVEFAFVSIVLMLLVFGMIDLGRAVFTRQMLTNAVREAARNGMVAWQTQSAPDTTTCTSGTLCASMVAAAASRSPTLGLTSANFTSGGSLSIGCNPWTVSGAGSITTCQPTPASPASSSGDRLTVCATYQFSFTAARLLGLTTIPMKECTAVSLQ